MGSVSWIVGTASALLAASVFAGGCGSAARSTFENDGADGGARGSGDEPGAPGFDRTGDSRGHNGTTGQDPLSNTCATGSAEARRLPVYLQFVIDGSRSMDGYDPDLEGYIPGAREQDPQQANRMTGKKWIAVRGALNAFLDDLAAKKDASMAVGLYLFSSTRPKSQADVDVPIAFVDRTHAEALKARLAPPVFPNLATPLCESLSEQLRILTSYAPVGPVRTGGKYVMIAMTDGVPSTDFGNADQTKCLSSAKSARTGPRPVSTFAVGVGDENAPTKNYDEAFMRDLAEAGGTTAPGCNPKWGDRDHSGKPCHFQITPGNKTADQIKSDFLAAINAIRDSVGSCDFPLIKPEGSGEVDVTNVNVVVASGGKDRTVTQDAANGWVYDDAVKPTKVLLRGDACAEVKANPATTIKIVLGCKTVTNITK